MEVAELLQNQNSLVIVRSGDLQEFANQIARQVLSGQPAPIVTKIEPEKPLSQAEAVKFLGKSRQTLIKWRKKGIIQSYRLGGRVYFKPSELLEALKKN